MSSFQLYSGVDGRNAVIPIPTIPTRMFSLLLRVRSREIRDRTKDCRTHWVVKGLKPGADDDSRGTGSVCLSTTSTSRRPGLSRSEEHTSELQSHSDLVCRLLLEKKKK